MKKNLPKLYVQMFGKFILTYDDRVIPLGRNSATKAIQLLLILLYSDKQGIARDEMLERLYGDTDAERSVRSLYSCVRYLKDILAETSLPKYDYIVLKNGIYYWDAPMETVIDAKCFLQITKGASIAGREDAERLLEACRMYRRRFLPDFSDQEWVLLEGVRLKRYYTDTVNKVCAWLMQEGEFEEVFQLAEQACLIYPFDEWQMVKMQCLMAMGRPKDAVAEYLKTQELLRKELDVEPSEQMQELFRTAKEGRSDWGEDSFADALGQLKESGNDADIVYYCDLPGFRDTYRMIARRIEYNGKSASLMLLSLGEDGGLPADGADAEESPELKKQMKLLKQAIWQSLRRTDVFTQCSNTQYLVLLYGVGAKDGKNIAGRIRAGFSKSWRGEANLTISVAPVEPAGDVAEPREYKRIDDIK